MESGLRRCKTAGCTMPSYAVSPSGYCLKCEQRRSAAVGLIQFSAFDQNGRRGTPERPTMNRKFSGLRIRHAVSPGPRNEQVSSSPRACNDRSSRYEQSQNGDTCQPSRNVFGILKEKNMSVGVHERAPKAACRTPVRHRRVVCPQTLHPPLIDVLTP